MTRIRCRQIVLNSCCALAVLVSLVSLPVGPVAAAQVELLAAKSPSENSLGDDSQGDDSQGEKGKQARTPLAGESPPGGKLESWYAATVAEDEEGGFLMVHFWSVGPLFRSEAVLAGRPITTIVDLTHYYIIDGAGAVGVAIERSPEAMAQDGRTRRPFGNELEQLIIEGGELIGQERLGERDVDVFRLTNSRGRRTIWASSEEPRVPLRMETFDRATSTIGKVSYTNWIYGPKISRTLFEPDPRVYMEKLTYEQYKTRAGKVPIGPAPVLYRHLLHGSH